MAIFGIAAGSCCESGSEDEENGMTQTTGLVTNVGTTNTADSQDPPIALGRQNDQMVSDVHGKWYTSAYRGRLFEGSTAAAGTTIPVSSATAATFTLYNPIGSGVNLELVSYDSSVQNATTVVSSILLGIASGLIVAPTAVTALTVRSGLLGSNAAALGQLYSVATIVATTTFFHVGAYGATSGAFGPVHYDFDGKIILAPGSLVHVCGTAAQTSASAQSISWAEWGI